MAADQRMVVGFLGKGKERKEGKKGKEKDIKTKRERDVKMVCQSYKVSTSGV